MSRKTRTEKARLRDRALSFGWETGLQPQASTESAIAEKPESRRCAGMALDRKHKFVQCPKTFTPSRSTQVYHSHDCYLQTWRWKGQHHILGEVYVRGRHVKPHAPKACKGWTVRDGVIIECAEQFTPDNTRQKYHSPACLFQARRWRSIDLHVGDSVRTKCAYRKCKKGPGGAEGILDRIRRRDSDHFCDGRCNAAERRCREADRVAKIEAQLAQGVRTMPHRPPEDKRAARVNQLRKQGLTWKVIHHRIQQEFKTFTSLNALQTLLKRYLERQKAA